MLFVLGGVEVRGDGRVGGDFGQFKGDEAD